MYCHNYVILIALIFILQINDNTFLQIRDLCNKNKSYAKKIYFFSDCSYII